MRTSRCYSRAFTLVEIMIVVAIIGILIAIAVLGFIRARSQSRMKSCQENMMKISGAKEQWALENSKSPGSSPGVTDIATGNSGYLKTFPIEPAGGSYAINAINAINAIAAEPSCSTGFPGHSVSEVGLAITQVEQ